MTLGTQYCTRAMQGICGASLSEQLLAMLPMPLNVVLGASVETGNSMSVDTYGIDVVGIFSMLLLFKQIPCYFVSVLSG